MTTNGYPFPTQKQIVARLVNQDFQVECLAILCGRQTDDELEEKVTKYTNKRGLRSSEAVWMPTLADKIVNGEEVTGADWDKLAAVLPVYRKQLAHHFRVQMLKQDPTLAEKSRVFGV